MTAVLIINLVGETTPAHHKTRPGYAVPSATTNAAHLNSGVPGTKASNAAQNCAR